MRRRLNSKLIVLTMLTLTAIGLAAGCARTSSSGKFDIRSKKVLARVDGAPVYEGVVHRRILAAYEGMDGTALTPTRRQMLIEAATDSEIMDRLLLRAARAEGMKIAESQADALLQKSRDRLGEENYRKMLTERKASEQEFRTFLLERELIEQYKTKLFRGIKVDQKTVREYFDGHRKDFALPDSARIEVLAATTREKADGLHRKWSAGATFDAVASEAGVIEGRPAARRLRFTPYDAMPGTIGPKAKEAEKGAILSPLESNGQFYVVRILEKRPGGPMTFEQAKEEVRQALIMKKQQEILDQWYERESKKARIEHVR